MLQPCSSKHYFSVTGHSGCGSVVYHTGCEVGKQLEWDTSPSHTHTHSFRSLFLTKRQVRAGQSIYQHVLGIWPDTREPGKSIETQGERTWTGTQAQEIKAWSCHLLHHSSIIIILMLNTGTFEKHSCQNLNSLDMGYQKVARTPNQLICTNTIQPIADHQNHVYFFHYRVSLLLMNHCF